MLRVPLPNAPAGSVMEGIGQANQLAGQNYANQFQQLQNQFYAPNMQSQINQRNALTQGQNITNQYLPEKLRLGNTYQDLQNRYYGRDIESQIGLRGAQARHAGASANQIDYMIKHPGLMGNDQTKMIQSLMDMGILDPRTLMPNQQQPGPAQQQPGQMQQPPGQGQQLPGQPGQVSPLVNSLANNGMAQQTQFPGVSQENPFQAPLSVAPFNTGNMLLDSMLNRPYAGAAYQQKMSQGFNWVHLPVETKNQLIAQGYGMGIDPLKMMDYVNKGMSLQQIAQKEGLDPENLPPPIYPPTTATKTRVQQVEQVGRELDYLSSATTPIIKRYADTFAGYSPERIKDMFSSDPEAQKRLGEYAGALSLQTGLANGRVLMEGGRPGVEVMREVKNTALRGVDQHIPIKWSKIAFEQSQKTIDEILQKGAKIRTTTGMNPMSEIGRSKRESSPTMKDPSEMTTEEIKQELAKLRGKK